jgi:hypothetical protein
MQISVDDRLLVTQRKVTSDKAAETSHVCRVLSVWGPEDAPTYLVLRYDNGNEELLVPNAEMKLRVLNTAAV